MHFALPCLTVDSSPVEMAKNRICYKLHSDLDTEDPHVRVKMISINRKVTQHIFEVRVEILKCKWAWWRKRDVPGMFPGDMISFAIEGLNVTVHGIVTHVDTDRTTGNKQHRSVPMRGRHQLSRHCLSILAY